MTDFVKIGLSPSGREDGGGVLGFTTKYGKKLTHKMKSGREDGGGVLGFTWFGSKHASCSSTSLFSSLSSLVCTQKEFLCSCRGFSYRKKNVQAKYYIQWKLDIKRSDIIKYLI